MPNALQIEHDEFVGGLASGRIEAHLDAGDATDLVARLSSRSEKVVLAVAATAGGPLVIGAGMVVAAVWTRSYWLAVGLPLALLGAGTAVLAQRRPESTGPGWWMLATTVALVFSWWMWGLTSVGALLAARFLFPHAVATGIDRHARRAFMRKAVTDREFYEIVVRAEVLRVVRRSADRPDEQVD